MGAHAKPDKLADCLRLHGLAVFRVNQGGIFFRKLVQIRPPANARNMPPMRNIPRRQ
jgi:hypothetical protein